MPLARPDTQPPLTQPRWLFAFIPPSHAERQKFNAELAGTLTKSLQTMLVHSSSEKGRSAVPLITNASSISPFPIKMAVKVGGVEVA